MTNFEQLPEYGLMHELRSHPTLTRPKFYDDTSVRSVVKATLEWMMHVADRRCDVMELLKQVKDGPLTRNQAQKLRNALIREMPGILQWMDEQGKKPRPSPGSCRNPQEDRGQ